MYEEYMKKGSILIQKYLSIQHHGIAGQKWGVRHGPPYPIEDKVLKKGEKLNNVSWSPSTEASLKTGDRWLYTYNKNDLWDNKVYKGPFALYKMRMTKFYMFEHEYEVLKDLKMPSKKDRIDEFISTYETNSKKFIKELMDVQTMLRKQRVGSEESRTVDLKKLNFKNIKDINKAYEIFNHMMEMQERYKFSKEYAKRIMKNFDAMVDDNNQGIYNEAHDPVIIFKPEESLKAIGSAKMLTIPEVQKNYNEVKEALKKKGKRVAL